jgi:inosine-uridine nucleoside N-ribohydrolase
LYRKVLAGQPDRSVVLVSVGMLTNLRNLLQSGGDASAKLDGMALVKKKVRAWVCMGGAFPRGREYNLYCDAPAAVEAVKRWPTPVVFSGFEIGGEIMTGARLRESPVASPVRRAYELYNGLHNRQSWDLTAVFYAVRGLDGGLADYWDLRSGRLEVARDGSDIWHDSPRGPHKYLVKKLPPQKVAEVIGGLMLESPRTSPE